MKYVLERLYKIIRSKTPNPEELVEKWLKKKGKTGSKESWYESFYEKWEKAGQSDDYSSSQSGSRTGNKESSSQNTGSKNNFGLPEQVFDDLATFNLTPPSSLDEVKKARNREIKKYHSDKFINDPEKLETSKKIMQIYNAAYERLKDFYEGKA